MRGSTHTRCHGCQHESTPQLTPPQHAHRTLDRHACYRHHPYQPHSPLRQPPADLEPTVLQLAIHGLAPRARILAVAQQVMHELHAEEVETRRCHLVTVEGGSGTAACASRGRRCGAALVARRHHLLRGRPRVSPSSARAACPLTDTAPPESGRRIRGSQRAVPPALRAQRAHACAVPGWPPQIATNRGIHGAHVCTVSSVVLI